MIGAIVGDIVGSRFEFNNHKSKQFELFTDNCFFTDDTVMTLAVAKSLINYEDVASNLKFFGKIYPNRGYGGRFNKWLMSEDRKPYNSYGNGSAMRVSPVAYVAKTLDEVKVLSRQVTEVTHNHPEGIKGAESVAVSIFLARQGFSKEQIKDYVTREYYDIGFNLDSIRESYSFDETCQGSVPEALQAFFESNNFEDAIRNAISIGGDSDTIAAITGSVAEAYYGVPEWIDKKARTYLDGVVLRRTLERFERWCEINNE